MRRQFLVSVVLMAAVACTGEDGADDPDATVAVPPTEITLRPSTVNDDRTPAAPVGDEGDPVDVGEPVPAFEPQATTPVGEGIDADDLLREEPQPVPTTPPVDEPTPASPLEPRLEPLEPAPLAWTLRRSPDPSDRTVELLVDERGCDGDRSITDRLEVSVRETDDRIRISVARREPADPERRPCPTNPLTPIAVALDAEVGDRRLEPADGPQRPASTPLDDVAGQLSVRTFSDAPTIDPLTSRNVADTEFRLALDCADGRVGPDWRPAIEFTTPEIALAEAAIELGRSAAPWHEFVVDDGDDRGPHRQWVVATAGSPVALVSARRGVIGWTATATSCPRTGERGDEALNPTLGTGPDGAKPPSAAPPVAAERIASLSDLDGLTAIEGTLRWDDPERRCASWASLEDALVGAGFTLGSERSVVDRETATGVPSSPEPIVVARQLTRRVDHPDGTAALLTTTAAGVLLTPVATRDGSAPSRLQPCRLDGDAGRLQLVVR